MIDVLGPFILILFLKTSGGGITSIEMRNEAECRAAITQLEQMRATKFMAGYCIAKHLKEESK